MRSGFVSLALITKMVYSSKTHVWKDKRWTISILLTARLFPDADPSLPSLGRRCTARFAANTFNLLPSRIPNIQPTSLPMSG